MRSSFDRKADLAHWVKRMWRHQAVNARNGARIGVHTAGSPSGEPILLLPSLLADWRSWNDVVASLPSGAYSIAMDPRGHGARSPSTGGDRLADLAASMLHVKDSLALSKVQLVGTLVCSMFWQSFGAHDRKRT